MHLALRGERFSAAKVLIVWHLRNGSGDFFRQRQRSLLASPRYAIVSLPFPSAQVSPTWVNTLTIYCLMATLRTISPISRCPRRERRGCIAKARSPHPETHTSEAMYALPAKLFVDGQRQRCCCLSATWLMRFGSVADRLRQIESAYSTLCPRITMNLFTHTNLLTRCEKIPSVGNHFFG